MSHHGCYFTPARGRRGGHKNRNLVYVEVEGSGSWAKRRKIRDRAKERYQQRNSIGEGSSSTQNEEVRKKREFVMSLNVPTGVLKRVEKQLQNIHEKREDEISVSGVFRRPKNYVKENYLFEETKNPSLDSPSSSRTDKYENIEPRNDSKSIIVAHEDLNANIGSTTSNFIRFNSDVQNDLNMADDTCEGDCVLMEMETPLVEVDDEVELKPLNQTIIVDSDDDCYVYEPPRPSGPRLRPFYLEEINPVRKKFPFDEPVPKQEKIVIPENVTLDFVPLCSKAFVPLCSKAFVPLCSKAFVPLCSKAFVPLCSKAPRWTMEDCMDDPNEPMKEELKDEWVICVEDLMAERFPRYRPLPLKHEGQQYKYGYYDLITGSFTEKLEEDLSKGVSINVTSPEIYRLSEDYYNNYVMKVNTTKYKEMLNFRESLPAFKKKKDLLEQINSSQVIVISGETGCGKSTQIPQIILDDAILNKRGANVKVLVTQPRRIAASSLAARVSEERAESMGESVGYAVRLEKEDARARGSITYCTTGVLLADLEVRQAMSDVSHIILDEVHERDCNVDLAMCMLKQVISKRKDLKLILMSATLDAESLSKYFDDCPTMHIEGLTFSVTDIYLEDILKLTGYTLPALQANTRRREKAQKYAREVGPILQKKRLELSDSVYRTLLDHRIENLNIDLIFALLSHICKGDEGAVLVFVPGIADITKLLKAIENSSQFPSHRYDIHPLHSKLSSAEQKKIFNRPPKGVRKIVIATNIAETSITIDDVVYVIDSAKIKVTGLNAANNVSTLAVEWVSQANLRQRRGRAGRVQAGVCYHLISSFRAEKLPTRLLPELQRSNLLEPVLAVKKLRLGRAEDALSKVPDPPDQGAIRWAVEHLKRLGALDDTETLTPLGWHLARLPVHPAAGKLLLFGTLFGCLDRAASVAASWGFKDPFLLVIGKEQEVHAAKCKLAIGEPSDHVAISEAVRRWETFTRKRKKFAREYFLSPNTLNLLSDMKKQFAYNLRSMGFLPDGNIKAHWENRNSDNLSVFKAVVAAALYPQFGTVKWIGLHRPNHQIIVHTPEDGTVDVHPSSTLATPRMSSGQGGQFGKRICSNAGANWHVYWMKQKTSKLFLFDVTLVHTMPLVFFGELNLTEDPSNQQNCFINISSVKVKCNKTTVQLLVQLRNLLDEVLASKVASPDGVKQHGEFEENVLNAVIELITAEDQQTNYMDYETDKSDTVDVIVLD